MDATAQKFLFDTRFDLPEEEVQDPEELARERARQALIEEGRLAGLQEAETQSAQTSAQALSKLPDALSMVASARAAVAESTVQEAAGLAALIVRKAMPGLTAARGTGEIEALIVDCLRNLVDEPRIVVRLNDSVLDEMREKLDPIVEQAGFQGDVVLLADPGIAEPDCRVEWADGGATRNEKDLWTAIDAAAGQLVASINTSKDADQEKAPQPETGDEPTSEARESEDPLPAEVTGAEESVEEETQ